MKKVFQYLCAGIIFLMLSAPASSDTLNVTYEYPALSLPFLVALDRNLFKKHGVNVLPTKLAGNRLNFSTADIITGHGLYILRQRKVGPNRIGFAQPIAMTNKSGMIKGLLVKKSARIKNWKDFKNKTIVISDYGIIEWQESSYSNGTNVQYSGRLGGALGTALAHEKSSPGGILVGGGAVKSFSRNKKAHALHGFSYVVRKLQAKYPKKFTLFAKNLEARYFSSPHFVATTYINIGNTSNKKDAVRKYFLAVDEAIDFIRKKPKSALSVLPAYYPKLTKKSAQYIGIYKFYKTTERLDKKAFSGTAGGESISYHYKL